jgi:hypothetical protein
MHGPRRGLVCPWSDQGAKRMIPEVIGASGLQEDAPRSLLAFAHIHGEAGTPTEDIWNAVVWVVGNPAGNLPPDQVNF